MSLIQKGPVSVSDRKAAANRQNALNSTGPRTGEGKRRAALNALRHGLYASLDTQWRVALQDLGQDPDERERIEEQLIEAWEPRDAMEMMIVRDLASLYWVKLRAERLEAVRQVDEVRRRKVERFVQSLKHPDDAWWKSDAGVAGYGGFKGGAPKFGERLKLLDQLRDWTERCAWPKDAEKALRLLWGDHPSTRLEQIRAAVCEFVSRPPETPIDDAACEQLKKLIADERAELAAEHEKFERRQADDEAREKQCDLAWVVAGSPLVVRHNAVLDRLIGSKIRLLLRLQGRPSCEKKSLGNEASMLPEINDLTLERTQTKPLSD